MAVKIINEGGEGSSPGVLQTSSLAAASNGDKLIALPIAVNPTSMPVVTVGGVLQDSGTKLNSVYWSGDGGATARYPKAGDYLHVNPAILGAPIRSGLLVTVQYSTTA